MNTVSSLAGTNRQYVAVSVRPVSPNKVEFDREEFSVTAVVGPYAFNYVRNVLKPNGTNTEGCKAYTDAQVTVYDRPTVHVQIAGPTGNREYGAAFNVNNEDFFEEVDSFLTEADDDNASGSDDGWGDDEPETPTNQWDS